MAGKNALITGVTGQDGSYLAKFLLERGYAVYGTYRRVSTPNFWRLQYLGIQDKVNLLPVDLNDTTSLIETFKISKPDEVYNLAAQSFVGTSFEQPVATGNVTGLSVTRMLEVLRQEAPNAKFYQASTSELYGDSGTVLQNEDTPFHPKSPYATAKLYGYWVTRIYRDAYGLFACNGILFNHESPVRGLEFVTRKISNSAAKIALGLQKKVRLGNLSAMRDWGYAPEYVEAMWLMLQEKEPSDFVIATGEAHSVDEFLRLSFDCVGHDCHEHLVVDRNLFRPLDVNYLAGDCSRARRKFGWSPKTRLGGLAKIMVAEDLRRWERWMNGEKFAWDAPYYEDDLKIITRGPRV